MGNSCGCGLSSSSFVWAGDDWESIRQGKKITPSDLNREDIREGFINSSSFSTREVKIKITKRELEDLMAEVDMQGLSMEQIVARLINSNKNLEIEHHHRSWKPSLQSIPE